MENLSISYLMNREIKIKTDDFKITSPTYHYYKQKKLLLENIFSYKKVSLSLLDCLWLKTLDTFRKLGCDLKTLTLLHQDLILDVKGIDILNANLNDNIIELESKISLAPEEHAKLIMFKDLKNNKALCNAIASDFTTFSNMVSLALDGKKCFVFVNEDRVVTSFYCESYEQLIEHYDLSKPHVTVEIGYILKEMFKLKEFEDVYNYRDLSESEDILIDNVRDKNVLKIEVTKTNDGVDILHLKTKEKERKIHYTGLNDLVKKIVNEDEVTNLNMYKDDGKNFYYSIDKKIKMKDKLSK